MEFPFHFLLASGPAEISLGSYGRRQIDLPRG